MAKFMHALLKLHNILHPWPSCYETTNWSCI